MIKLSAQDRLTLERMGSGGSVRVRSFKRARVLLLMDSGLSASAAAIAAGVEGSTARRICHRYNDSGLASAIEDAPRPGADRALNAKQEANIVAIACSRPPEGAARWSISLIAKEVVLRGIIDKVSESTIARLLRCHEIKPWREKNVVRRKAGR
jgi:transposase